MDQILYLFARAGVTLLQALPLKLVARLGRAGGALAYRLDGRHRRVATKNIALCFGRERSLVELRALARENFRRIGENFACAIKTAAMSLEQLRPHVEIVGAEKLLPELQTQTPPSCIVAIGHFGNFELYARFGQFVPVFKCATTYRGLSRPSLNRLMQSLREPSGCRFFERRTETVALKTSLSGDGVLLGLLADQRAAGSARLPFLGHDCSTSFAPAVFALRYRRPLHTAICYRLALAHWRIEIGDQIPTRENGVARSTEAITRDVNRAFEIAVRRDPANWFWVHDRWKPSKSQRQPEQFCLDDRPTKAAG